MGHTVAKDVYRKLGRKIDGQSVRAPWNEALHAILKELYTTEEADLVVQMPYGLADFDKVQKVTGYKPDKLRKLLDSLCSKGLVMDIWLMGGYRYVISPLVIGIFEFTMMRTRGELNLKEWAGLFHTYMQDPETFHAANFKRGEKVSPLRALPYEETIDDSDFVEVLDYEKASAIVDMHKKYAIGLCSCRHEKLHAGVKKCDVPLETCSTMGPSTDYLLRHGMAKEVSKTQMQENLARSKELGLVLCADNCRKNVSFICHCCGCCCNVLQGISRFGYAGPVVTSTFIVSRDEENCTECGMCVEACPINAIGTGNDGAPEIDESICLGCGVCALHCAGQALKLLKRRQRVFHPEDTFERIILQCLERGTLQNLFFDNPRSISHKFMRGVVGGFLKLPPVQKALMSDGLRSRFLATMRK
ncbi:MAG: 4Fe-4S binding protein [Candidatus Zixiibacteriota bacterium]|nr:MAG: 4Fe-4S binding protein [candidate division Zixibacteria bacterium]